MAIDKPNYTQIPNLLLDDLMRHMSPAEFKVTCAIARQTFGFHRERAKLTIADIEQVTGMSRPTVIDAIAAGIARGTIDREPQGNGRFTYSLIVDDEVVEASKESLPVKKLYRDASKESLPPRVKNVDRCSKESLPELVKDLDRYTPVLKKEKETIKEMVVSGSEPTNQLTMRAANDETHHALAVGILVKVGIATPAATRLADTVAFLEIRRQVAAWLPERNVGKANTGALIHRIETGWGAPDLSAEFIRSEMYRDFRTPAERQADEEAEAEAKRRIDEFDQRAVAPVTPQRATTAASTAIDDLGLWEKALLELKPQWPPNSYASEWLEGSTLVQVAEVAGMPLYQVQLLKPDGANWLGNRAGSLLRRTLSSLMKQRVLVEVVCAVPQMAPVPKEAAEMETA
jgi:phage replication O-like protein O